MVSGPSTHRQMDLFEIPKKGMQKAFAQAQDASQRLADGEVSPEVMVDLLQARTLAKANSAVLRTVDEMVGSLFDRRA